MTYHQIIPGGTMTELMKKQPAMLVATIVGVCAAAGSAVAQATTNGQINWWTAAFLGLPLVTGALTRGRVFSPQTVEDIEAGLRDVETATRDVHIVVNGTPVEVSKLAKAIEQALVDGDDGGAA